MLESGPVTGSDHEKTEAYGEQIIGVLREQEASAKMALPSVWEQQRHVISLGGVA